MSKEYGYFSEAAGEYIITERKTPRHWYNYFFNETYNGFASQVGFGEGLCQDELVNRVNVITDRCVYITDKENKTWHTAVGLPITEKFDFYECRHGLGYSVITCEKNGIRSELTIYVPAEGDFENWSVKVTNLRKTAADLSVIGYGATDFDGPYVPQGYNNTLARFYPEYNGILGNAISQIHRKENPCSYVYMITDGKVIGYDCRKTGFIGTYGTKDSPEALVEGCGLTNSECCAEKVCFALETQAALKPGETKTVTFKAGHTEICDLDKIGESLKHGMPEKLLEEIKNLRAEQISQVEITTPDENLNNASQFYKYATNMGSYWARVRHNGYRDMCGDTDALATFNPKLAWERAVRILEYQYSNGYAPRTVFNGAVRPNNFADCAVWITPMIHTIVNELGDVSLLEKEVGFNDGTTASVFEHCRLAVEYLYNFKGKNGLIKIWGGDWNDGLNKMGLKGDGVSVWLSIAWYRANKLFIDLCRMLGKDALIKTHEEMGENMRLLIEQYGWDGEYYIAAINDYDVKLGSKENEEGKMWLNPNTWAVLAGVAEESKLHAIMDKVDSYLECPYGTRLNWPPSTSYKPYHGTYPTQPAGTLLNASVYLQPLAWKMWAEAILKKPAKVQEALEKILPWNHKWSETKGEPYILYNYYCTEETGYREGVPGQSWRTATHPCVMKGIIRYIYGICPEIDGLHLDPCLPPDWKECEIKKDFRGCEYVIRYHQTENSEGKVSEILADGKAVTEKYLPYEKDAKITVDVYVR